MEEMTKVVTTIQKTIEKVEKSWSAEKDVLVKENA